MKQKTIVRTDLPNLTANQASAQELQARRPSRRGLIEFCHFTFPRYEASWHHKLIARKLEEILWGKIKKLMIFAPPRHGKSELASIRFPIFYLGHKPQHSIIATSYAEKLACTFSRAARETVTGPQYQRLWKRKLAVAGNVRWQFENKEDERPSYIAAGIGGSIAGEGANGLIIDDPIKNPKQAYSKGYRDDNDEWYKLVARTRLQPRGWVLLMMTRWHEDDLAGRLLKREGDEWTVLILPAANPEGKYGLKKYDALWPSQYGVEALAATRKEIGSVGWGALYQQDPHIAIGSIFKRAWFKFYKPTDVLRWDENIQIWDTAFEPGQENDYSACGTLSRCQDRVYVSRVWQEQVAWPDLLRQAHFEAENFERVHRQPLHRVLIENKGSGISLRQALQSDPSFRWPVFPMEAKQKKQVRASGISGYVEAGQVYVLEGTEWVDGFIDQLCEFPRGMHDDMVDMFVHGMTYFAQTNVEETEQVATYEENVVISPELDELEQRLGL